jgi:hypothetical protein
MALHNTETFEKSDFVMTEPNFMNPVPHPQSGFARYGNKSSSAGRMSGLNANGSSWQMGLQPDITRWT